MSESAQAGSQLRSGAFNFSSFIQSGVDPRTGSYSCSLSLSELLANYLCGPSLPLILSFNSFENRNIGFGAGWSMRMSSYTSTTHTLSLSSGVTYRAYTNGSEVTLADKKLETINVYVDNDVWVIQHKDGTVEELSRSDSDDNEWLPSRIYSTEGRYISFLYSRIQGRRVVREVRDAHHCLIKFEYESDNNWSSQPGFTLWPDSAHHKRKFIFIIRDSWLRQIRMLSRDGFEDAHWMFDYQPSENGGPLITHMQTPLGAVETLRYAVNGHALPIGAPVDFVPVVLSWTVAPGLGLRPTTRVYDFSSTNYFGYGAGYIWSEGGDPLNKSSSDYTYSSRETSTKEGQSRSTERVYNRFHLMISETTVVGTKVQRKKIKYHDVDGLNFYAQPAIFQQPKQVVISYFDSETPDTLYSEITTTTYDNFGNVLELHSPAGGREVNVYYSASGEDGCPASPSGLVSYLKSKRILPAPDFLEASTTEFKYRYVGLPSLRDHQKTFLVLLSDELYEGGVTEPVLRTTYSYVTDPRDDCYGKVSAKTDYMGGASTCYKHHYSVDQRVVRSTQSIAVGEQLFSQFVECDRFTGQEVRVCDHSGHVVESLYDGVGRLQCETVAVGALPVSQRHTYQLPTEGEGQVRHVLIDSRGAQHVTLFDGLGRKVQAFVEDLDHSEAEKPLREVYLASYDAWGQLSEEITTDWFEGVAKSLAVTYIYDDWGNATQVKRSDGSVTHEISDPVSRTQIQWLNEGGQTVTVNNIFGKPSSIERIDTEGLSLGKTLFLYDGLGRCRQRVTPEGAITQYRYDLFGRVIETVLPDSTVISKQYDPRSIGDYPVLIKANDYVVGTRDYDPLMRISRTTVGGRTEHFRYEQAQTVPSSKVTPSGVAVNFTLDPLFQSEVAERHVTRNGNLRTRFSRDTLSGQLLQASSPLSHEGFHYSDSGKLKRKEYLIGDQKFESTYTYSLMGIPIKIIDVMGNERRYYYNSIGRIERIEQGAILTVYSYDSEGVLKTVRVSDTKVGRSLLTTLSYDAFGREVQRVFKLNDDPEQVLEQTFTAEDKLQRRRLLLESVILRDEKFQYDVRGRLSRYQCSGSQSPVDAWGKVILSQDYEHDYLDNILTLKTRFSDGENIATYTYAYADRTQLSSLTHSHADYHPSARSFEYDADGCQLTDEVGRLLKYDELGSLCSVAVDASPLSPTLVEYTYNAMDELQSSRSDKGAPRAFFYHEGVLVNQRQGLQNQSYLQHGTQALAQTDGTEISLLSTDQQGSILHVVSPQGESRCAYTPYGSRPFDDGLNSLLGFNGELLDPHTGCYLLGNGYRAYNPILMRFHSPDSLSVFDGGGLNAYGYCLGDPINYRDPTGHITVFQGVRMALSIGFVVASLALTIFTFGAAAPSVGLSLTSVITLAYEIVSAVVSITSAILDELAPDCIVTHVFSYTSIALGGVGAVNYVTGKIAKKGLSLALQKTVGRVGKAAVAQSTFTGNIAQTASRPLSNSSALMRGNDGYNSLSKLHKRLLTTSKIRDRVDYVKYAFTGLKLGEKHYDKMIDFVNSEGFQNTTSHFRYWQPGMDTSPYFETGSRTMEKLPMQTFFDGVEDREMQIRNG